MDGRGDFDRKLLSRLGNVDRFYLEAEIDAMLEELGVKERPDAEEYDRLAADLAGSAAGFDGGQQRAHLLAAGLRERARRLREG